MQLLKGMSKHAWDSVSYVEKDFWNKIWWYFKQVQLILMDVNLPRANEICRSPRTKWKPLSSLFCGILKEGHDLVQKIAQELSDVMIFPDTTQVRSTKALRAWVISEMSWTERKRCAHDIAIARHCFAAWRRNECAAVFIQSDVEKTKTAQTLASGLNHASSATKAKPPLPGQIQKAIPKFSRKKL